MDIAYSLDGIPIRLTSERWFHIVENHDEMAGYYEEVLMAIEAPELLIQGHRGSLMAICSFGHHRYLTVIYRQISDDDGFVITAFFADSVDRKKAIWQSQ